jgi:hypothetical protein
MHCSSHQIYNIKEIVQPKMSLNNREFIIWKEREGVGRQAGGSTGIHI